MPHFIESAGTYVAYCRSYDNAEGQEICEMNIIGPTSMAKLYRFTLKLLLLSAAVSLSQPQSVKAQQYAPELFNYGELVQLYEREEPAAVLQVKLQRLLTTPFVNNALLRAVCGPACRRVGSS